MSRIYLVSEGYEISNYSHEIDWEDAQSLAEEIVEKAVELGKVMFWVSAGNIDWRGSSGYGVFDLSVDESDKFWTHIAGVDADWTLRSITKIYDGEDFDMICSHHDAPTGGLRKVHLMSPKQAYDRLRKELEIPRQEIVEHYDTYTYRTDEDGRITNEMIYEAIEYAGADVYQELVESA